MKLCIACGIAAAEDDACSSCGHSSPVVAGIVHHAPEMARSGEGFRPEYFEELARLEAENFWFRARNDIVIHAIRRCFGTPRSMLEIGCGTGFVLSAVSRAFPDTRLWGSELFPEGLAEAAKRLPGVRLMQMDARRIPYRNEFDLIGAFDVLEHIEEDEAVLAAVRDALKPRGGVIFAVPQHPWLWSRSDDYACHVRRYRPGELEGKLRGAGFEVIYATSFVTLLFPILVTARLRARASNDAADPCDELRLGRTTNALLYSVMRAEHALLRTGVRFPFGGSRLVCATKKP